MRLRLRLVSATTLYFIAAQIAHAHAILVDSTPANNQTIVETSLPVELHFNSRIDGKHSRLWLVKPNDEEVILPLVDSAPPNTLKTDALNLEPGAYRLRWQVLSVDGHITRGEIPFRMRR
jgi:methionine-rich copper-binding protein CopC